MSPWCTIVMEKVFRLTSTPFQEDRPQLVIAALHSLDPWWSLKSWNQPPTNWATGVPWCAISAISYCSHSTTKTNNFRTNNWVVVNVFLRRFYIPWGIQYELAFSHGVRQSPCILMSQHVPTPVLTMYWQWRKWCSQWTLPNRSKYPLINSHKFTYGTSSLSIGKSTTNGP